MDSKGFTLIELIATVALLAIIALISFVSVSKILQESKVNDCKSIVNNIKTATKEYVSDNRYGNLNIDNFDASILINGKYLSSPIVNPFTKEEIIPSDIKISITLNDDYTANSVTISAPSVLNTCSM